MSNPLLNLTGLPPFSEIKPEHVEPAVRQIIEDNRKTTEQLLAETPAGNWEQLIRPLQDLDDRLSRAWSPVTHLNAVVNSGELREAYEACLPILSEYSTEMGQNRDLYTAYKALSEGEAYQALDEEQRKVVDNAMRDFRLSGIDLPAEQQARYKDISQRLSQLASEFQNNVLDATNAWEKHITDEAELAGLPESAQALAAQTAEMRGKQGWVFTLDIPYYLPVITYSENEALRREIYEAYGTRASDQGPHAGQWDNGAIMEETLQLRHELSQLLGFNNYAEYSLATKMADSTEQVLNFLTDLAERSLPVAQKDLQGVRDYAAEQHGKQDLNAWDIPFYSEKLRQDRYELSQEELKPYFPAPKVLDGMFRIVERLYGIEIRQREDVEIWHEDVSFYEITDSKGELRGQFYFDLYARPNKRGGAWMADCIGRRRTNDGLQTPVAFLTCNFTPPIGDDPALLTHDEVITTFHEFGHGLHHMLTQVNEPEISGISGVAWDAVELPSQFMENWCWEREALDLFAAHYQTGEPLPEGLYQRMRQARDYQSGMQMVRQLEFALFDFRMHREYDPAQGGRIYDILDTVREQVAVIKPPTFHRFPHGFGHIFAGGYAAGYYSYKWAEVLSADAFSRFEEEGLFNPQTGADFLHNVLERGGSRDAMTLFVDFRGREPSIDALLRHSGIAA